MDWNWTLLLMVNEVDHSSRGEPDGTRSDDLSTPSTHSTWSFSLDRINDSQSEARDTTFVNTFIIPTPIFFNIATLHIHQAPRPLRCTHHRTFR